MAISKAAKGKKRAREDDVAIARRRAETPMSSPLSSPPPQEVPRKKKKAARAETRQCPVCDEHIPLRLLSMHAALESERVEAVIQQVGKSDVDFDFDFDDLDDAPGPSSRVRRSAAKAKKTMQQKNTSGTLEQVGKTIQTIKRHRKNRHAKLKELAREEEEGYTPCHRWMRGISAGEIVCPVCAATVRGDQDVVDAHVDSCLANESRLAEERQRQLQDEEVWEEVDDDGNAGHVGDVTGTGFHTRDRQEQDVDEEIDIDGDDQAVYGEPQFTEGDILPVDIQRPEVGGDVEVEVEGDSEDEAQREQKSLRDLVAEGKVVKRTTRTPSEEGIAAVKAKMDEVMGVGESDEIELAIIAARRRNDKNALIAALENKVLHVESMRVSSSTSLLCRICIDPYSEPTVSTGCWHTCCRECWLRCLGSTKLCPICKRITNATELRRIYL